MFLRLIGKAEAQTAAFAPPPESAQHDLGQAPRRPKELGVLPLQPKPLVQTYTGAFSVNTDSREQVRDFFNAVYHTSENVPILSTVNVADCFPGTNSPLFMEAVLRRINWFRAMAGEPANVVFNSVYNSNAQAVAVMISSSGRLNHNPPTNWPCWSPAGAAGAGGNQAGGFDGADAITGYIWDFGNGNSEVGHRRWILLPQEQIMGTGDVPASGTNIAGNSTYVFDSSINGPRPATRKPYVSWPPEGFVPYQVTFPYWSFALSNADFSAATVSMLSNGAPVSVSVQPYQTGYGENTIVWVPMGLDANCDCASFPFNGTDTVYTVTVTNIQAGASTVGFTYNVTVFDPAAPGTDYVATAISGPAQPTVGLGNAYAAVPLANTNVTGYQWLVAQLAPGSFAENDASNLNNGTLPYFTDLSNPDYSILTNVYLDNSPCIHFVHTVNDTVPQIIQCTETLLAASNSMVSFDSQVGYAFTNEVARVQVSTDNGMTWQDVPGFLDPGCNDPNTSNFSFCEGSFTHYNLSLANYAGQFVLLRFNYDFLPPYEYFVGSDTYFGWSFENIVVTNVQRLSGSVTNSTVSTNFTFTPLQAANYELAAAPVLFTQFPLAWGPLKAVTAVLSANPVITLSQPTLGGGHVQLNFSVLGGSATSFHLLQAGQLNGHWTTNTSATLTTNTPGSSYRFTATIGASLQFYRVQVP